jgi:hypothetical protein
VLRERLARDAFDNLAPGAEAARQRALLGARPPSQVQARARLPASALAVPAGRLIYCSIDARVVTRPNDLRPKDLTRPPRAGQAPARTVRALSPHRCRARGGGGGGATPAPSDCHCAPTRRPRRGRRRAAHAPSLGPAAAGRPRARAPGQRAARAQEPPGGAARGGRRDVSN